MNNPKNFGQWNTEKTCTWDNVNYNDKLFIMVSLKSVIVKHTTKHGSVVTILNSLYVMNI